MSKDMKTSRKTMSGSGERQARILRKSALSNIESQLRTTPDAIELRFNRAQLLMELGRTEEAKQAYLEILALSPSHRGALNNLGSLLHASGFTTAARTCYTQAVMHHPDDPMGHVNLANSLRQGGEMAKAHDHYQTALRADPDHPEAHQGLSFLLQEQGEEEAAEKHRRLGFQNRAVLVWPYRGRRQPVYIVLLASAMGGNAPLRSFLDDNRYHVTLIFTEFYDLALPLPPHNLIINAIGDADLCRPGLEIAEKLIAASQAPILNHPGFVLPTGRIANSRRLGRIPDVITPKTLHLPRDILAGPHALENLAGQGIILPFLLRAPGFHNGQNFFRVEDAGDLEAALAALPGRAMTIMQFLDARNSDGKIRKYRIMLVGGRIYPLHAAISSHWKIHHVTAEMADNPEHREEEEAFLRNMPAVLGKRAMQALKGIRDALGLDYAGVDFSLNDRGQILLFEANAPMVVQAPDPDKRWDYRRRPVERVIKAIGRMIAVTSSMAGPDRPGTTRHEGS